MRGGGDMTYAEMLAILNAHGIALSERDPNMNSAYEGKFMCSEEYPEGHTQRSMGDTGSYWCFVGNSAEELVEAAYYSLGLEVEDAA